MPLKKDPKAATSSTTKRKEALNGPLLTLQLHQYKLVVVLAVKSSSWVLTELFTSEMESLIKMLMELSGDHFLIG